MSGEAVNKYVKEVSSSPSRTPSPGTSMVHTDALHTAQFVTHGLHVLVQSSLDRLLLGRSVAVSASRVHLPADAVGGTIMDRTVVGVGARLHDIRDEQCSRDEHRCATITDTGAWTSQHFTAGFGLHGRTRMSASVSNALKVYLRGVLTEALFIMLLPSSEVALPDA